LVKAYVWRIMQHVACNIQQPNMHLTWLALRLRYLLLNGFFKYDN
jgi:hypothetical protein